MTLLRGFIIGMAVCVSAASGQTSGKPQPLKQAVKIADKCAERCGLRFDSPEAQIETCADTIRIAKPFQPVIAASVVLKTVNNEPDGGLTISGTFDARSFDSVNFLTDEERLLIDDLTKQRNCAQDKIDVERKAHRDEQYRIKRANKGYLTSEYVVPHHLEHERELAQIALNETATPIYKKAGERKADAETITVTLTIPPGAEIEHDRTMLARAKRATFHFTVHNFSIGLPYDPPLHDRIPARIIGVSGEVIAVNPKKAKGVVEAGE